MPAERTLDTRSSILEAAERLILDRGLGSATTREIARAAGCAEGSIYRYFDDKQALCMELVGTRYAGFFQLITTLPERAGVATVRRNLEEVATSALDFYRGIVPMMGGALAEHELMEALRDHFLREGKGPMKLLARVAEYLRREQRLGRVSDRVSADLGAQALLGSCFGRAFLQRFLGPDVFDEPDDRFARSLVKTLVQGLEP
jgi:AcrR family transcriptional regulator